MSDPISQYSYSLTDPDPHSLLSPTQDCSLRTSSRSCAVMVRGLFELPIEVEIEAEVGSVSVSVSQLQATILH